MKLRKDKLYMNIKHFNKRENMINHFDAIRMKSATTQSLDYDDCKNDILKNLAVLVLPSIVKKNNTNYLGIKP